MIRHYLNIAWRHVQRKKGYAALNVMGLAVGMACCLLITLYVLDEVSYDNFHSRGSRIYRLLLDQGNTGAPTNANTSWVYGPYFQQRIPEIEKVVRFRMMGWGEDRVVASEGKRFYEPGLLFADSTVFDVFSFALSSGDPHTALDRPHTIVLTESTARKYFGNDDPMGQSLQIDVDNNGIFTDFTVTGVMHDVPSNSHLEFDFLASFSSQTDIRDNWGLEPVYTYVLLAPGSDPAAMHERMHAMAIERLGNPPTKSFFLQALRDIHFGPDLNGEFKPIGNQAYIYSFGTVAVIILLLACINFANLATARSMSRTSEMGMRKVMGAARKQLVLQFLGEAFLVATAAVVLAIILTELALPLLNGLADKELSLVHPKNGWIVASAILTVVMIGTASGAYPALYIASLSPITGLKRKSVGSNRHGTFVRRGLVVLQFSAAAALIILALTAFQQIQHMRTVNLGYERDEILVMPINEQLRSQFETFRHRLGGHASVRSVTATEQVPGRAGNGSSYRIQGLPEVEYGLTRFFADPNFVPTYGLTLIAGTTKVSSYHDTPAPEMIITEGILSEVGIPDAQSAIGRTISFDFGGDMYYGYISGVVKDIHLYSLREQTNGMVISHMTPNFFNFVSVRVNTADVSGTLSHLRRVWSDFSPSYPFDYYFLDQDFDQLHRVDLQFGKIVSWFTGLAIFVAALGLVGLATFAAQQRQREISIRKVLGASVPNLVALLSNEFLVLVLVANIVALPAAYFAANRWLQHFVYRIDVDLWMFLAAGAITLLLALISTGVQTLRTALSNPVETLRYE